MRNCPCLRRTNYHRRDRRWLTPCSAPEPILEPPPVRRTPMNRLLAPIAALALLLFLPAPAHAGVREEAKAEDAARVLGEIMRIPEIAVPEKMFTEAYAIAVVPDVVKAGLFLGGRGGKG